MPYPDRPPRAANSHCLEQARWLTGGWTRTILGVLASLAVFQIGGVEAQEASGDTVCLPPEAPYVPGSDEDFIEYVDVVSGNFERYFSELTAYFTCMDGTRRAVFERAGEVSKDHQAFWARAQDLGAVEKAATGRQEAVKMRGD